MHRAATASRRCECVGARRDGGTDSTRPHPHVVRAGTTSLAGGAINSPALLLRSQRARPARHARQAHLPASDRDLRRADAGSGSTACAARRSRSTPTTSSTRSADRRPDRLQARGAAAASGAVRHTLPGFGAAHARWMRAVPAHAGPAGAAARRLPSAQSRAARCGCAATASPCSTTRSTTSSWDGARRACSAWRRSSSRPARAACCRCTSRRRATQVVGEAQARHRRA